MYAKMAWEKVINLLRLASTWLKPSLKDSIKLGEIDTFLLEVIELKSHGIGNDIVCRLFGTSITSWLGGCSGLVE